MWHFYGGVVDTKKSSSFNDWLPIQFYAQNNRYMSSGMVQWYKRSKISPSESNICSRPTVYQLDSENDLNPSTTYGILLLTDRLHTGSIA